MQSYHIWISVSAGSFYGSIWCVFVWLIHVYTQWCICIAGIDSISAPMCQFITAGYEWARLRDRHAQAVITIDSLSESLSVSASYGLPANPLGRLRCLVVVTHHSIMAFANYYDWTIEKYELGTLSTVLVDRQRKWWVSAKLHISYLSNYPQQSLKFLANSKIYLYMKLQRMGVQQLHCSG